MLEKSIPLNRARNSHFYSVEAQTSRAQGKSRRKLGKINTWKQHNWQISLGGAVTQPAQCRPAAIQKLDET